MKATKRMRVALVILASTAGALVLVGFGCGDRFVLPPVPAPTGGDGSPKIDIPLGDGVIEAYRARSPGAPFAEPRAYVLRFTGDANQSAKFTASRWRDRGIEAWVVNYPGYGGSTGPRTLRRLAEAALVTYDALKKVAGERPIILEGFSLGTTPALHVAAHRPVAGLVLQNPPALRQIVLRHGWWNLWLLAGPVASRIPPELDSLANTRRCRARAIFIVAERDRSVPPDLQREIQAAYGGPNRLIVQFGADHVEPLKEAEECQLREGMDWILSP